MAGALLRTWRRNRLLTSQFVITIAVGMGAAVALVSLMLALGYQPLPYRDPGRLVAVWEHSESGSIRAISGPDAADFALGSQNLFASLGAFTAGWQGWLLDRRGATRIHACYIQASVLSDLGIRPLLGRPPQPDDIPIADGSASPVWISQKFWQARFGGSPSVVGATVGISSSATGLHQDHVQIAGVLPSRVGIPHPFHQNDTDVWYLAPADVSNRPRAATVFFMLGRLRSGVSVSQAETALTGIRRRLAERSVMDRFKRPLVQSLEAIAQGPVRQTMGLLSLGVALVFLVGLLNLAILMRVEGAQRQRDIAVRAVLGASRRRVWTEVAAEKCLLTLISVGMGVAVAKALVHVLSDLLPAAGLGPPLASPPPLNFSLFAGFAGFLLIVALIWSALLVAVADGRGSSSTLVNTGGGPGYTGFRDTSPKAGRWRLILLAAQAGMGICLLSAAALTSEMYHKISAPDLGSDPRHTLSFSISMPDDLTFPDSQAREFNQQLLSRLERLPATRAIALSDSFPPFGEPATFAKQGDPPGAGRETTLPAVSVSPGYFRALGVPIRFGRAFSDSDDSNAEPVAIVSFGMAAQNWSSPEQAVGSRFAFGPEFKQFYRIVGVSADFTGYWSQTPVPTVYRPIGQSGEWCRTVIARTSASPSAVAAIAPRALARMPIPATIENVATLQARWQATQTRPFARMVGMTMLAVLGLALSVQGVYAVAAGTAAARRHELAVRSALGAEAGRLAWNVTRNVLAAVVFGSGLGLALTLELQPLMKRWLGPTAGWRVEPIAVASLLLALAAIGGCYFPARSATRANPAEVLRQG
jgi:putative ABC transport system permease protein